MLREYTLHAVLYIRALLGSNNISLNHHSFSQYFYWFQYIEQITLLRGQNDVPDTLRVMCEELKYTKVNWTGYGFTEKCTFHD